MKILVLGSHGFIGSHLVSYFLSKGVTVTGCDLVEDVAIGYTYHKVSILSPDFDTVFSTGEFDVCINSSGSGNVSFSMSHPLSDFEANTMAVAKVLDTMRKYQPACKYVHISSAAVYGNPETLPVREEMPLRPLSPYGWHKVMSEMLCREYYELYRLKVAIVRPFSVFGNGLRKQLLWDVCRKMREDEVITLYGTGKESRDFIHIDDLCFLLDCIVKSSPFEADMYNGGNGIQVTISTIVDLLKLNFKSDKPIRFNGETRKGDPLNWKADTRKIKELGYTPKVSLEDGVKDYVSFFLASTTK
jgi:UDP-glucose 4-epimerase